MRLCILFLCSFLLTSCVISPWKTLTYDNLEIENVPSINPRDLMSMPDKEQFEKYYVHDTFIVFFCKSKNETVYDSTGPFRLGVQVTGEDKQNLSFTIHKMHIVSAKGNDYTNQLKTKFPITIVVPNAEEAFYSPPSQTVQYYYTTKSFVTNEYFDFQSEKGIDINVTVDIEVKSDKGSERKIISYILTPIKKWGLFKPLVW